MYKPTTIILNLSGGFVWCKCWTLDLGTLDLGTAWLAKKSGFKGLLSRELVQNSGKPMRIGDTIKNGSTS